MRYGFTTGSCAAAAAKAAAYMLLTGKIKNCITIETPKGIPYTAEVTDIVRGESQVKSVPRSPRTTVGMEKKNFCRLTEERVWAV